MQWQEPAADSHVVVGSWQKAKDRTNYVLTGSFGVILALGMFSHCYTVPAPPKVNAVHWKLVTGVSILVLKCATGGDFSKWVHGGEVS